MDLLRQMRWLRMAGDYRMAASTFGTLPWVGGWTPRVFRLDDALSSLEPLETYFRTEVRAYRRLALSAAIALAWAALVLALGTWIAGEAAESSRTWVWAGAFVLAIVPYGIYVVAYLRSYAGDSLRGRRRLYEFSCFVLHASSEDRGRLAAEIATGQYPLVEGLLQHNADLGSRMDASWKTE
jgi:hypothetical protein